MNELLTNEQLWWYVARSGGIVALILTGLSVIWGLLVSTKAMQGTPSPKWLLSLHKYLGGLAVSFTGVHIAALMLDSYVQFGVTDILVPFASDWKPGAVAWGVVSMYLLIAVQASSLMMKRLPRKVWKWIHMSSWLLFWSGLIHGITAGTDAGNPVYILATGTLTALVSFLTLFRVFTSRMTRRAIESRTPVPQAIG
ncbi:MAG: ferric reductase-like transmembrane domain-containing protein [Acidimicrobiales bacterium]